MFLRQVLGALSSKDSYEGGKKIYQSVWFWTNILATISSWLMSQCTWDFIIQAVTIK